jgi:ribosomal protein S18 acetylase RimI-like enzyme
MLRDLRRADGRQFFELLEAGFPEESAVLGNRPEEFEKVFRRVFRWDVRLMLVLMKGFGRPIVRALVVEADGRVVATSLVTFPARAAYVSSVVVDVAYRRRGYARRMLEEAYRTAQRSRRKHIVLDVLDSNTGARALYDSLGYRPLRQRSEVLHDSVERFAATAPGPEHRSIRPVHRSDVPHLVELARRQTPPEVEAVLPTGKGRFVESRFVNRILVSEEAAWVVDRGHGPEAHVAAMVSRAMVAAHVGAPVIGESVDDRLAAELVSTAGAWCAARQVPRMMSMVAVDDLRGRAALEAAGFRHARTLWTLCRPVD